MQDVQIKKDRLLKTLKENKEKHEAAFHEAAKAFYEKFAVAIEEAAQGVRAQKLNFSEAQSKAFFDNPPQGHCDEYEMAIKQLEYDERKIIELSSHEFAQYVLDEWGWKQQFAQSYHTHTAKFLGS